MKNIKYIIQFYSPWHCGSGLSAGADVDTLAIKDKNNLPYIPGKTLKGLIREAAEDYASLSKKFSEDIINKTFGQPAGKEMTDDKVIGTAFFTNAVLDEHEAQEIVNQKAQRFLYNHVSSTAIDKNGIAKEHSLRTIETTIPCTLHASIYDVPDEICDLIEKSLGLIHHIGVNRSRGLGRCDFKIEKGEGR